MNASYGLYQVTASVSLLSEACCQIKLIGQTVREFELTRSDEFCNQLVTEV
jgi:hypothetical protein